MTAGAELPEPARSLQEVRTIVLNGLKDVRARVYLFGSHATGRARRTSDIDVGIIPVGDLPLGLLSDLREALEESAIPYHVDVVDLSRAERSLRERVLQEGVLWNDCTSA